MYQPHYKPNQLIVGENSSIAIVTGWTPRQAIAKQLSPENYAVIGNLYSPERGINFLIRNLLLNPEIQYLIIMQATKEDIFAGASQCLLDFFNKGFRANEDNNKWLINSEIFGILDKEIKKEALETLRNKIVVFNCNTKNDLFHSINEIKKFVCERINTRKKLSFPEPSQIEKVVFPGNRYGHRIEGKTIAETWVKILHRIKTTGTIRPTGYDGQWQELIDLMAVVTDEPKHYYFPEPNYLPFNREFLSSYVPQMLENSPYQEGVKYTYGQRLRSWFGRDQVEEVINKLIKEIDSASAVMNLWDSGTGNEWWEMPENQVNPLVDYDKLAIARFGRKKGDSDHQHGGSPCLNHIWIRVVNNELSLTATFRSNDMFSAWPANAMGLRALQQYIKDEINKRSEYNLTLAPLITISQSAHIYDECWENVDNLIKKQTYIFKSTYSDKVGNFLINIEDNRIKVEWIDNKGDLVKKYIGRSPLKLIAEITTDCTVINPYHLGYLGIELQKAKQAIDLNGVYEQDK